MEPEGSLLYSQEPATSAYSEPDQSSPFPHPTYWRSILILSAYLRMGLPNGRIHVQAQQNSLTVNGPWANLQCEQDFHIWSVYLLPTHCTDNFCVILVNKRCSFPIGHWPIGLSNGDALCFLCGRECFS